MIIRETNDCSEDIHVVYLFFCYTVKSIMVSNKMLIASEKLTCRLHVLSMNYLIMYKLTLLVKSSKERETVIF
jgi:hypothetical protein